MGEIPGTACTGGGNDKASDLGTSTRLTVKVSPLICTALSGTFTIQKRPFGKVHGLKSCSWELKLRSHRSSHISTKMPLAVSDSVAPAVLTVSAALPPWYVPLNTRMSVMTAYCRPLLSVANPLV